MRKNLLAVISAFFFGILAMLIPLCVWYQVNFPDMPLALPSLGDATRSSKSYETTLQNFSMTPFYVAFILSFVVSVTAYVFSKRCI